MKTQVQFDVVYNPALVNQIGDLMSKMDLGIEGLLYPQTQQISFTTTTKVDKKYIQKMSDTLREAYEKAGNTVYVLKFIKKEKINEQSEIKDEKKSRNGIRKNRRR